MKLRASHHDGFTTDLLCWELEASAGSAIVTARWHGSGGGTEILVEMPFPDARIRQIADSLAGMRTVYDGCVDDFPTHTLAVDVGGAVQQVRIHEGIEWPSDDQPAIDRFMSVWRPLSQDVEELLAIPGRAPNRKKRKRG